MSDRTRRAARASASIAALTASLTCAAGAHAQIYVPPTQQELGQRVAAIQASAPARAADAPAPRAPRASRDGRSPATLLSRVQATLDRVLASRARGGPGIDRPALARARTHVATASRRYGATATPRTVLRTLGAADVQLARAARSPAGAPRATLVRLRRELVTAARRIADRIVRLAARSGARATRLADGRAALRRGAREAGRGAPGTAFESLGQATSIVLHELSVRMSLLATNIRAELDGETMGYAFTTARDGKLHTSAARGFARTSFDMPMTGQSPAKEMHIASMSKTISAVALLKLLDDRGIPLTTPITGYLPSDWFKGPGVQAITFRDLLRHTSGLQPVTDNTASSQRLPALRGMIHAGSTGLLGFSSADYTNANYGLLRVLIPRIATPADVLAVYLNVLPDDEVYAALYADYVADQVLAPANIPVSSCSPRESWAVRTRYYAYPHPASGIDFGDWSDACGATGWYLSAHELGSLLAHLRFTTKILDAGTRQAMDDDYLGWLNPYAYSADVDGAFGTYRAHGGDNYVSGNRGMTGCMMNFPLGVQATLLINSRGGAIGRTCGVLRAAYDRAWGAVEAPTRGGIGGG